nr:hypothetical protein [Tanacetum cinerariifolium]
MKIVTTTKKPEDEATETPKEEHARAASGVLILSIRPMMRIHPELEMMSSPSTIKLTDIVLEIPITNSSHKEAKKVGIDFKVIESAKSGEQFKRIQDAEIQVHKREHCQKVKKQIELKKKRHEQYMWTTSTRLKLEPISDVKIHPNKKPAVLSVYKRNDKRNFDVHNPFKFADFRVTELDELGLIIEKKKSRIVKELMICVGKGCERMRKILEELRIYSALPAPAYEQASSQLLKRK